MREARDQFVSPSPAKAPEPLDSLYKRKKSPARNEIKVEKWVELSPAE